jgi:hypothetical protein
MNIQPIDLPDNIVVQSKRRAGKVGRAEILWRKTLVAPSRTTKNAAVIARLTTTSRRNFENFMLAVSQSFLRHAPYQIS